MQGQGFRVRPQNSSQAYQEGYSQHMIARVLGLAQPTVQRIIKRTKGDDSISII
ncbi:MAG: helix-turn-helix domain-containing protein [Campylobacterota bacterium]|nr:helix-turn-helix domain-containing protein [Campylobacterota bacterium]